MKGSPSVCLETVNHWHQNSQFVILNLSNCSLRVTGRAACVAAPLLSAFMRRKKPDLWKIFSRHILLLLLKKDILDNEALTMGRTPTISVSSLLSQLINQRFRCRGGSLVGRRPGVLAELSGLAHGRRDQRAGNSSRRARILAPRISFRGYISKLGAVMDYS